MATLFQHRSRAKRAKKKLRVYDIVESARLLHITNRVALLTHTETMTPKPVFTILGMRRVQMLHEVWTYDSWTHRFTAYKNRGTGAEFVEDMKAMGINLKTTMMVPTIESSSLDFASDKDKFVFKLKYGI